MKIYFLFFILMFYSGLGFCQSAKTEKNEDEIILIEQKENKKYNITANFYGVNFDLGNDNKEVIKIITYVVFRNNKTGAEVKYKPSTVNNESGETGIESIVTPDFYFTNVWSPNEEYLVLPIGVFEGYGIFKAEGALKNIKENKYFDTIKTKSVNSGFYGHNFEKWEGDSTFSFRAGLDGDMFAFKYNIATAELYCYQKKCEEFEIGFNKKGEIKSIKKGDIEPTKIH